MQRIGRSLLVAALALGGLAAGTVPASADNTIDINSAIVNVNSGLCLDNFGRGEGGHVVTFDCNGGIYQQWDFNRLSEESTVGEIRSEQSGLCLDIEAGTTADGPHVIQWHCHGGSNQQWAIVPSEVGIRLEPQHASSRCLTDDGYSNDVWQEGCLTLAANQGWYLK